MMGLALDRVPDSGTLRHMAKESRETVARSLIGAAGGRVTRPRVVALMALLEAGRTVSHADLHRRLPEVDRVTLYRALDWLAEHHLAHRVADADGVRRYGPSLPQDEHRHPHFHCTRCGLTTCLEQVHNPSIKLPGGFTSGDVEVLVKGLCKTCSVAG
jgi:Fur family ferric uptake transcriptional regulator